MKREVKRILSVDVRGRSFGFVVFEGPTRLLDWGVRGIPRGKKAAKVPPSNKVAVLMDQYLPHAIVLRKPDLREDKKRSAMRDIVLREAAQRRIPVRSLSRDAVQNVCRRESE